MATNPSALERLPSEILRHVLNTLLGKPLGRRLGITATDESGKWQLKYGEPAVTNFLSLLRVSRHISAAVRSLIAAGVSTLRIAEHSRGAELDQHAQDLPKDVPYDPHVIESIEIEIPPLPSYLTPSITEVFITQTRTDTLYHVDRFTSLWEQLPNLRKVTYATKSVLNCIVACEKWTGEARASAFHPRNTEVYIQRALKANHIVRAFMDADLMEVHQGLSFRIVTREQVEAHRSPNIYQYLSFMAYPRMTVAWLLKPPNDNEQTCRLMWYLARYLYGIPANPPMAGVEVEVWSSSRRFRDADGKILLAGNRYRPVLYRPAGQADVVEIFDGNTGRYSAVYDGTNWITVRESGLLTLPSTTGVGEGEGGPDRDEDGLGKWRYWGWNAHDSDGGEYEEEE